MTQCLTYNQSSFASVIENINRELKEKGHLDSSVDENRMLEHTSATTRAVVENRQLATDMRAQNFDVIRFATYRTACKLRFIQRKTNMYIVDIWNVIEAYRENGLNSVDHNCEVSDEKLQTLLSTIFYQLNKRLPTSSQILVEESTQLLLYWLLGAYDPQGHGKVRVLSIKVALSTLCAGKMMDKLRYIFTQVSDSSGYLEKNRFEDYLKEILTLPTAVFEGPSFGYNQTAGSSCFDGKTKVTVNDFLDSLMSDPGPQCLLWLPILHRIAATENVFHPIQCEGCHRESFMGFRYKCQRCYNYHLCQDCFWRGRVTGNHSNEHDMREYSSYKSPAKQISHSLRKSFKCVPVKSGNHKIPQFPETPEKVLDLSHIVPATPVPVRTSIHESSCSHSLDLSSIDSGSQTKSPSKLNSTLDSGQLDDEHRLIARYAARLAADAHNAARSPTELNFQLDSTRPQRELIAQLEAKNKEILQEINRLRIEQEQNANASPGPQQQRNPTLLAELRLLRQRRDELETRMSALQESRRELMVQLEGLMKLLKSHGSPKSTPNSSPRSQNGHSPPVAAVPAYAAAVTPSTPADSLTGVGGDVCQAFGTIESSGSSNVHSLRKDLLVAADSVTTAMSSLVKELNSEASSGSEDEDGTFIRKPGIENDGIRFDEIAAWRDDLQQHLSEDNEFLQQLRSRKENSHHLMGDNYVTSDSDTYMRPDDGSYMVTDDGESYVRTDDESTYLRTDEEDHGQDTYDTKIRDLYMQRRYTTDDESCLETDQESYIRTDDEDGGYTDWEESRRRWINR